MLAKSFARIHQANLINVGILPLVFVDPADYDRFAQGDRLRIAGLAEALRRGEPVAVENVTQGFTVQARYDLSDRQVEIMLAGGLLNYIKARAEAE